MWWPQALLQSLLRGESRVPLNWKKICLFLEVNVRSLFSVPFYILVLLASEPNLCLNLNLLKEHIAGDGEVGNMTEEFQGDILSWKDDK